MWSSQALWRRRKRSNSCDDSRRCARTPSPRRRTLSVEAGGSRGRGVGGSATHQSRPATASRAPVRILIRRGGPDHGVCDDGTHDHAPVDAERENLTGARSRRPA
jgi:hypothetical protein